MIELPPLPNDLPWKTPAYLLGDLQKWMESSVWGNKSKYRSMQDEWSELAKVVQKPTCELIRDDKQTYLKLILPGVSTQEMDNRKLQLQAYQQYRDIPENRGRYNPGPFPLRWQACTDTWGTRFIVASKENEALTLQLPISNSLQTTDFALALNIAYQLEADREIIHQTCFLLRDLHIINTHGVRIMTKGSYKVNSVEKFPAEIIQSQFKLFKKEDLATIDV